MITDDDILNAMDDVDEEQVETMLAESDCFLYSLAKAIVTVKCFGGDAAHLTTALKACMEEAERIKDALAVGIAQKKDDARRFQAESEDDEDEGDFDEWYLNAEMGRKVA
jgi:hypothetical protein